MFGKIDKKTKKTSSGSRSEQFLLEKSINTIAEIQTRPYISVGEAAILFGMSKDTIYRLIKSNRISAHNFGERLTRVCKSDLESIFTMVKIAPEKEKIEENQVFEIGNCYTISEISANSMLILER